MHHHFGGPPDGFEDYVRARYGALRRLAFLLAGDWAAADDVVQTALIRCERRWALVAPEARHAYVRRAVVNASSSWRSRLRSHLSLAEAADLPTAEAGTDERLAVIAALRRLPVGQRQVLVLRYYEGLTEAQIAAELDIGVGTVKSRASRALAALRETDLRTLTGDRA